MLDDIRKSLYAALYERTSSPLYGTFILSWCLWNWQILYLLFWEEQKIDFISKMNMIFALTDGWYLIVYPILSTLGFLTLGNLAGSGAYWLQLKFDKWRRTQKEDNDSSIRLSLQESILVRSEVTKQQQSFQDEITKRETKIGLLEKQLQELEKNKAIDIIPRNELVEEENINLEEERTLFQSLKNNIIKNNWQSYLTRLHHLFIDKFPLEFEERYKDEEEYVPSDLIYILDINKLIAINQERRGNYTAKGFRFLKYFEDSKQIDSDNKSQSDALTNDLKNIYTKVIKFRDYSTTIYSLQYYTSVGKTLGSSNSVADPNPDLVTYLQAANIIEPINNNGIYKFSDKGFKFIELYRELELS